MSVEWKGVFPAVTTQIREDLTVDLADTQRVVDDLIRDGVTGVIALGTVGENNSFEYDEKVEVLTAIVEAVAGRVPVITGVSEYDTRRAVRYAQAAEKVGADGLMLLPPMVYVPKPHELVEHFKGVAQQVGLPIMLYNNPPAYRTLIDNEVLAALVDVANIVAVKESAPDTRRFSDVKNAFGDRYVLFAGLDDVALEGLFLGAQGWVSGLTNAFPRESVELVNAFQRGDHAKAMEIYRWFMPLLHLDAEHDLVQSIKLAEQVMGRGSERVLPPRYPLVGARRAEVIAMVEQAAATRPTLAAAEPVLASA
ncbi:dihydrodipicolinate synthase family protein [Sphingomonas sp. CFBP 13728]|uniref:dihydrodipicolinate synthase family protein n=1 Tax=unclassified Sphingomonas TaxID=196159 RepID=UPI0017849E9A|nr:MULTISPECIES: dihydrodipicolinate synthase family protein [unclassified Sphingomonas]MBD8617330.1 dihydrodipicolinate synthase family protein [Sphingomonas sp. CFBP 13728]MBE2992203.1 dihydrodipicolinate synthase family protein [Sphingomonas sp. CFBP 13603]